MFFTLILFVFIYLVVYFVVAVFVVGVGWDILCINSVSIEHIIYTSTGLKYW